MAEAIGIGNSTCIPMILHYSPDRAVIEIGRIVGHDAVPSGAETIVAVFTKRSFTCPSMPVLVSQSITIEKVPARSARVPDIPGRIYHNRSQTAAIRSEVNW